MPMHPGCKRLTQYIRNDNVWLGRVLDEFESRLTIADRHDFFRERRDDVPDV